LNSNLSKELIEQIVDIISYIENGLILDNNIGKKIDLVYILESAYNNEIFTHFIENNNHSEGLKHIEILIKLLSYFIEESSSNVYDTIANIYLLNNRLIEAEANILNCLQVETLKNNIRPEHNLTAAKIYYKKNDLINGLKYYNKAIELRASDASIKEFDNYLNTNNLSK
jgi:tetratricopeptide (TPR) repeat protein